MKLNDIPLDDPLTFQLLSEGRTLGVFQLEKPGMQQLLRRVRPTTIGDVAAVLALYRPGPLANGSHTEYARRKSQGHYESEVHPEIDRVVTPLLRETYGLIVFQEQVMAILAEVTGWDYAEADNIFNAMRKKQLDKMEKSKPTYLADTSRNGFSRGAAEALWEVLVPFSDYSFNKSHSVAYAHISYTTAYLKANHPKQFMTALMNKAKNILDISQMAHECRTLGIDVLPPDINDSGMGFTPTRKGIRYGLSSIKGIGDSVTDAIISGRPYDSIDDFFRRADDKVLNGGVLETLARCGACDSLWSSREELVVQGREIAGLATQNRRAESDGHRSFIKTRYRPARSKEGPPQKDSRLRGEWERETLGIMVTKPHIILTPSRSLDQTEWLWVREVLAAHPAHQEVRVMLNGTEMNIGQSSDAPQLAEVLALLGVAVKEV